MNNIKDVVVAILIGLILTLLVIFIIKLSKQDDKNYKECIKHYSENYCVKTIYGVY